jgi:curved DNA-binding protein CbpA
MTTLYELLGVKKNASVKKIREAYRGRAKKKHPDVGGDAEEFAALKKAHDILIDPERRAKYDATGDTSEVAPDNSLSEVIQILAVAMENVLAQIENRQGEFTEYDIVSDMKILIGGKLDEIQQRRAKMKAAKKKAEKLLGRFGVKKGQNYLEGIVAAKLSSLEQFIRQCDTQEEPVKRALDILLSSDFKSDASSRKDGYGYGASSYRLADLMGMV